MGTPDVGAILAMIKELADYEHEPDKVLATEDSLKHTLTFSNTTGQAVHTNPGPFCDFHAPCEWNADCVGYAKTFILRTPADPTDTYKAKHPDETPNAVAGMALFFNNYSTWRSKPGVYLEDLYVKPAYRKRGFGKLLLVALAGEVQRIGGGRLEWSCLKWNEPSLAFYKSIGAQRMDDWVQLRVDGEELDKLAKGTPRPKPKAE